MKIRIRQQQASIELKFGDHRDFCLLPSEMQWTGWHSYCRDGSRHIVLSPDCILIFRLNDFNLRADAVATGEAPVNAYYLDTRKLFLRAMLVREKFQLNKNQIELENPRAAVWSEKVKLYETTFDSDRFKLPRGEIQQRGVWQMIRHPNAKGDFAKTLKYFVSILKPEYLTRLYRDLSHYLDTAIVYGNTGEFYFDGRRMPGGCGFNGGFIPHKDEYGIHT